MPKQARNILVREGDRIPSEYTPVETVDVPAIEQNKVIKVKSHFSNVTTVRDNWSKFWPTAITVWTTDGEEYTNTFELLCLAYDGGGRFVRARLNEPYTCQTLAEYEAEIEHEAESKALEEREYW